MSEVGISEVSEPVETAEAVTSVEGSEPVSETVEVPAVTESVETYTVKIGEAEQEVTLDDLRNGFMRQADYTRKTQEVAAMRQRLAQAESIFNSLEADPAATLRALETAFGLGGVGEDGDYERAEVDPRDQRLEAIERQFQAQEQARVKAQIEGEIDTLLNTYGDFDLGAVLQHAHDRGMTVTDAYRSLHFDSAVAKRAAEESVTAAKREAGVVEGGAHRTGVAAAEAKPAGSIREAWQMARKQLGIPA